MDHRKPSKNAFFYYQIDENWHGPVSKEELKKKITPETVIWHNELCNNHKTHPQLCDLVEPYKKFFPFEKETPAKDNKPELNNRKNSGSEFGCFIALILIGGIFWLVSSWPDNKQEEDKESIVTSLPDSTELTKEIKNKSQEIDSLVSEHLDQYFDSLKSQNYFPSEIDPEFNVLLKLNEHKNIDLTAEYSYKVYYEDLNRFNAKISDYPSGEYLLSNSRAANATVKAMHSSISKFLNKYLESGGKVQINLSGFTDAAAFTSQKKYLGEFGDLPRNSNGIINYYQDNQLLQIKINKDEPLTNPRLAFLRAYGIKNYIDSYIDELDMVSVDYALYGYSEKNPNNIGGKFRKVNIELKIYDINR